MTTDKKKKRGTGKAPSECSARIDNGRLVCDCLKGKPEIQADITVCHPKMVALMNQDADA